MIWDYVIAMTVIPALFLGWLVVQHVTRAFAKAHPEFGPPREEGAGCGKSCMCGSGGSCKTKKH